MKKDIANPQKTPLFRANCVVACAPPTANAHAICDSSLGIHGKLHVMPTGHCLQQNGLPLSIEYAARRIERYALQEVARSILREMVDKNGKTTYVHQVRNCLRARISKKKGVSLFYNVEREQANFGNLQRCSSVWNCPICSMTITEGRRTELKQGLSNWTQAGGHAYLATFTNSHHRGDGLDGLIQGQKRHLKSFGKKRVQLKCLNA